MYKVTKIGWLRRADGFISERGNLEGDALVYGKPVKLSEGGGNVISSFEVRKNKTGKRVLNALKSLDR